MMDPSAPPASKERAADPSVQKMLLTIPLTLTVVLCERVARMYDVLRLRQGDVIEFAKSADQPLEVFIHHQRIARGVAVKVQENFGLRIVEIVPPEQTIRAMADLPPASFRKPLGGTA